MQRYSKLPPLPKLGQLTTGRRAPVAPLRVHNAQRRLGPGVVAQLVADYQAGIPATQLAGKFGVAKGTVLRLLRTAGVAIRQQPMTEADISKAIQLYQSGQSLAAVGEQFGRDPSLIGLVLKRAGIPRRDSHGRAR